VLRYVVGRSSPVPYTLVDLAEDVKGLLDHLGIERAHVVGYSLGAIDVAKLLTTHPQRFLSAVLGGAAYRRSQGEAARA
jgi:pimeloyl-ACP methyl ester carboxylesterase